MYVDHPKFGNWIGTSGFANMEDSIPIRKNSIFNLASITKTYTSVVAMEMIKSGQLNLDDHIELYLPNDIIMGIPNATKIKIRNLLNMSSGIYSYEHNPDLVSQYLADSFRFQQMSHLDIIKKYVLGKKAYFDPGQGYQYSTTNYLLIGMILENISKKDLGQLYEEYIFSKLGLKQTFLHHGFEESSLVNFYADLDQEGTHENVSDKEMDIYRWTLGDSGIFATAEETGKFMEALCTDKLLSEKYVDLMTEWIPADDPKYGFGLDYSKGFPYKSLMGHDGVGLGSYSMAYYFPNQEITVVLLTNTGISQSGKKYKKILSRLIKKASLKLFLF